MKKQNGGLIFLACSIILTVAMYSFPQGYYVAYPMILVSTLAHEMGHGLTAVMVGGSFESFVINSDASGVAYCGARGRIGDAMVSAGGLIGPAIVGAIFFSMANRSGRLFTFLGVFLILAEILVVRNVFGFAFVGICALICLYLGVKASKATQQIAAYFIGIQLALSVFSRGDYLFTDKAIVNGKEMSSDVSQMSDALFLPYWFWGIVCGAISILCLIIGIRNALQELVSKDP